MGLRSSYTRRMSTKEQSSTRIRSEGNLRKDREGAAADHEQIRSVLPDGSSQRVEIPDGSPGIPPPLPCLGARQTGRYLLKKRTAASHNLRRGSRFVLEDVQASVSKLRSMAGRSGTHREQRCTAVLAWIRLLPLPATLQTGRRPGVASPIEEAGGISPGPYLT